MPLNLTYLKKEFSIVEDQEGNPYAVDHEKYPNILLDEPGVEYEIHPVNSIGNSQGEVNYESKLKMKRSELTPKFVGLG